MVSNIKATLLTRQRIVRSTFSSAKLVLRQVPKPVAGSQHDYNYRLAYVVSEVCVVRYDNEIGKGDHRHVGVLEADYKFVSPEKSIADFQKDIARWNHEKSHF